MLAGSQLGGDLPGDLKAYVQGCAQCTNCCGNAAGSYARLKGCLLLRLPTGLQRRLRLLAKWVPTLSPTYHGMFCKEWSPDRTRQCC